MLRLEGIALWHLRPDVGIMSSVPFWGKGDSFLQ
jgi:hypothetical protein